VDSAVKSDPNEQPHAVFPDQPAQPSVQAVRLDSHKTYHSVLLAPADVIVIDLPDGLMVPEGDVLVIPLHDPTLHVHMAKTQFQAFFRQVERPAAADIKPPAPAEPEIQKAKSVVVEEKAKPAEPEIQKAKPPEMRPGLAEEFAVEPFITEVVEKEVEPQAAPVVKKVEETQPEQPSRPAAPMPVARRQDPTPINYDVRSIDGISPQIARHMAAIAHVQRVQKRDAVAVKELGNLLDERDHKQVSARMPTAWKAGFANRYESTKDQPLRYAITPAGFALLEKMHTWPWLREGLPIPKWANA
jgi:hypothetical protein